MPVQLFLSMSPVVGSSCGNRKGQQVLNPTPLNPHPCNVPQAKTEAVLRCRNCTATLAFLQCGSHLDQSCAAASEKLHCNIEKAAGFKPPRLGTHVSDLLKRGHYKKKRVFSQQGSLKSLHPLDSLRLENVEILVVFFPYSRASLESLDALQSQESLEHGPL